MFQKSPPHPRLARGDLGTGLPPLPGSSIPSPTGNAGTQVPGGGLGSIARPGNSLTCTQGAAEGPPTGQCRWRGSPLTWEWAKLRQPSRHFGAPGAAQRQREPRKWRPEPHGTKVAGLVSREQGGPARRSWTQSQQALGYRGLQLPVPSRPQRAGDEGLECDN